MWFFYALAFAVISSFSIIIAKRVMREVDQYAYLFYVSILTLPFLLIPALLFYQVPELNTKFWIVTITGTAISVMASILVYKAIRESDVSLINPISAFNPVFTALLSLIFLREILSLKNFLGVVIIVTGAYLLQLSSSQKGFFEPFKDLLKHKGIQLAFVAYFLWAVSPLFEKTAIFNTIPQNPPFAASVGKFVSILMFIPLIIKKSKTPIEKIKANWRWILLDGILGGLGISAAFIAYSLAPLGISTAIFKLSVVFVPILAWLFFKEKNIKERLLGSLVMLGGVVLLLT